MTTLQGLRLGRRAGQQPLTLAVADERPRPTS
jgi:hypothetical protein